MSMRIAVVSKLWERSDPFSTGGTGAVMGTLVDGLVARGHQVTLFATGDSRTTADRLVAVRPKPYGNGYSEVHEFANIALAFQQYRRFDLIHCAVEHKSLLFNGLVPTPTLHSIQYGEFFADELALLRQYRRCDFVTISRAMRDRFSFLHWRGVIYNGLPVERFPLSAVSRGYLLFLDRVSPQKGPDIAIRAARAARMPLVIAGKMVAGDRVFLDRHVRPYIDGTRVRYCGEVGFREKVRLLRGASAVLHPHRIFEAFGLTMVEAQLCGTPVIAFDRGAAAEVVSDGETGFIVNDYRAFVSAVKRSDSLDRAACRVFAARRFSATTMVERYEALYKKMIRR